MTAAVLNEDPIPLLVASSIPAGLAVYKFASESPEEERLRMYEMGATNTFGNNSFEVSSIYLTPAGVDRRSVGLSMFVQF